MEDADFSFRHTIYCVPLPFLNDWQAKIILGIFWSSLGRYRLFMTSGTWGTWYDKILAGDILSMPIRLPIKLHPTVERIVSVVDSIRSWRPVASGFEGIATPRDVPPPASVIDGLSEAVFDLFDLSETQRDLVRDFEKYVYDMVSRGAEAGALKPMLGAPERRGGTIRDLVLGQGTPRDIEGYLEAFLDAWNRELAPTGEFRWRVLRSPDVTMQLHAVASRR